MAAPKRHEVTCPSCSHTQREYVEATSVFCHACGHHYSLKKPAPRRATKSSKASNSINRRQIQCIHCEHTMQIPDASDSWQCAVCSEYLDLKNRTIDHSVGRSILTYGDIVIQSRGSFSGNRAEGQNINIEGGRATGKLIARSRIEVIKSANINADLKCESLQVYSGVSIENRKSLRCHDAVIGGEVRFHEVHVTGTLVIKAGGRMHTEKLSAPDIKVEIGGVLKARSTISNAAQKAREESVTPVRSPTKHLPSSGVKGRRNG